MSDEDPAPPLSDVLALSESTLSKERQEGVIDNLSTPGILERFSLMKKKEPKLYAMAQYLLEDIAAIEKWERDGGAYHAPDMSMELLEADYNLRTSSDGFLIKVFKSISHLTEGASTGGRVGFWGRRKG